MKRCSKCLMIRQEDSFYADGSYPDDVCKPCVHRPRKSRVRRLRSTATATQRAQKAIRYVVKQAQQNQSFVYLVETENRYKIGYSTNVDKRIRQLSTAASAELKLIAVTPGGRPLEQALHHSFRGLRIRGEWFVKNPRILDEFSKQPEAMVFLPGYITATAPPAP